MLGAALILSLGACDGGAPPDQVAVRGDNFEITLAEFDQLLRQAPPQPKERVASARREILNGLIDEKLLAEAAVEAGIDKNTDTVQAIEAARRSILAQAYVSKVVSSPANPDEIALRKYYDDHPNRYGGRTRLRLQEIALPVSEVNQASVADLDKLGFDRFVAQRNAQGKPIAIETTTVMSDVLEGRQPPLGANVIYRTEGRLHLGKVVGVDPAPVPFEEAKPLIAQRIGEEQTRNRVAQITAKLRKDRKVEVVHKDLARGMK